MAQQLNFITQEDVRKTLSLLVYGTTGSGKSQLLTTISDVPEMLPALVVVCDNSEITLATAMSDKFKIIKGGLSVLEQVLDIATEKTNPYKTIAIDNLTSLQRVLLEERAKIASIGKSRTQYEYTPADYGVVRTQMLTIVDTLLNTKLVKANIIATAWAEINTNPATNQRIIDINLSGKLASELPGMFLAVGYLFTKTPTPADIRKGTQLVDERHLVFTQSNDIQTARCVGGKMIDMTNPTIAMIRDKMYEL